MKIEIRDDFDLDKMISCGQCFRAGKKDDGSFFFISGDRVLKILPLPAGAGSGSGADMQGGGRPAGQCFEVSCGREEWDGFWSGYFDLGRNYSGIRRTCLREIKGAPADGIETGRAKIGPEGIRFLEDAEKAGRGLRILRQDPWEMLITFIISQRKNMPAIAGAVEKLSQTYGHRLQAGENGFVYSFPTPGELGRVSETDLRELGLGYRAPYVRDATDKVLSGGLDLAAMCRLDDEELFEKLMSVRGVGKKVANCICLFGFGRTSRAPVDVWITRAIERCGGTDPFPLFGEYAGIMQQYVFYAMTHGKE